MTKSIKLSEQSWHSLITVIQRDYPKSVWLSRDKMRRVLGFVPREHKEWNKKIVGNTFNSKGWDVSFPIHTIYLDFYDDKKKTIFMMKYSEYLDGKL